MSAVFFTLRLCPLIALLTASDLIISLAKISYIQYSESSPPLMCHTITPPPAGVDSNLYNEPAHARPWPVPIVH